MGPRSSATRSGVSNSVLFVILLDRSRLHADWGRSEICMLSRDEHAGLVARLYASAVGDTPWAETLALVAGLFRSKAIAFSTHSPALSVSAFEVHGYSKQFAAEFYASGAWASDPRIVQFARLQPGSVYYDHLLYDVAEMQRHPQVRDNTAILGVKYQLGAMLRLPNGASGGFAILSTDQEGHASESAIGAFRRLAPHLEQACALGLVMEERAVTQSIMFETLANKADGIILLGPTGAPTFVNDAAQAILAAGDGLVFTAGGYATRRQPETRRLNAMIRDALAASQGSDSKPGGQMLVTRPSGLRPYVLRVMPAPPSERFLAGGAVGCVIHLHDLAAVSVPSKVSLAAVFGLSEREADLAIELVRCASLAQAATNVGMAVNTARNHLQSIFAKSGAANQAEAVQLFGQLV